MKIKKKFFLAAIVGGLLIFAGAKNVFAVDQGQEYPSIFWGAAQITTNSGQPQELTTVSQADGSEILRNLTASSSTSPALVFGPFCTIFGQLGCFALSGSYSTSLKLLTSRTYFNGYAKVSTAVLKLAGTNVFGDSYQSAANYNYWGKHLNVGSGNSDAFWQLPNYQFNSSAQAYWDSGNNSTMESTISRLELNTKPLGSLVSAAGDWIPVATFDGVCGRENIANCPDTNQYPDGRVWIASGGLSINNSINFQKKATIIVENGDLTIDAAVADNSADAASASLGFIVKNGNVTIKNSTGKMRKINSLIFAPKGKIIVSGSNLALTGSFVANDFSVSGQNVNFIQDSRGAEVFPPGFRDLLPMSTQSK